jgi:hypothetical protein
MDLLRRNFAAPMADGSYAIPSLANPVNVDPSLTRYRSDFWGSDSKVGQVAGAFGDYWGGIWDIMTGNNEVAPANVSQEQAALESQSGTAPGSGDITYMLIFGAAIAGILFFKKGGF